MLLNKILNAAKRILNINKIYHDVEYLKEENEYLKNLFKITVDITKAPKARGDLRTLQLGDLEFLKLFDFICKENNLTYWLDGGSLLGSVRHNGFIPWDDDIDVAMLREDYNKIGEIFKKALPSNKFEINYGKGFYNKVTRIIFKNSPFQIDIWPFDKYYTKIEGKEAELELYKKVNKCNKELWTKCSADKVFKGEIPFPSKELETLIHQNINTPPCNCPSAADFSNPTLFRGPEVLFETPCVFQFEDIFPLTEHIFEDIKLPVPGNYKKYLERWFNDYMEFPKTKITGHIDINEKYKNLDKKYEEIKSFCIEYFK